jgi:hypothetical protein
MRPLALFGSMLKGTARPQKTILTAQSADGSGDSRRAGRDPLALRSLPPECRAESGR